ncbi:hypothetical protein NQ009_09575 [Staphylococcus hyicus]|uniref:hypothetical protein n=2 Tax=Staphylococcus hyicus TaxID=1284 RepID=UPI000F83EE9F|nr:hypothetical protein [Staphylococcus hyicus]MCQ9306910.1 hypothetical protein [Staphylococcus hyicus]MCQ9309396.1 hypothetical protein [Staphylococcus hyicus]RTX69573.1 hypothetical protein EKQ60_01740 [Staphylococcus hyicus]
MMVGELFELLRFFKGIVLGEYSYTFLTMSIFLLLIIVICEVVYEAKQKNVSHYVLLILEKIFWNVLGFFFFIGMYRFIMRFVSNMSLNRTLHNETLLLGEMGMIAYISMVVITPLSIVLFNTNHRFIKMLLICIQLIVVPLIGKILSFILSIGMITDLIFWLVHISLCVFVSHAFIRYAKGLNT